ncbi:helix-turn-helix domain-containing protein [Patulibacter sp.]|uniref:winged helix-turn-helix transcriptional regulator n=1 Tax=Patulibacter sp. TaxID=1912859 RepID=UPI002720AB7A|nr:helix-turn-helix domain-containing protein [Patulibacter sp.]MDO9410344.1 helix-turn-helix domain-containing protein [Patulibacter sp.]
MDLRRLDSATCSVARAVDVVGQPWVLLVLREAFHGLRRFSDMQDHLGVSRSVLASRLEAMVQEGLLERSPYREPGQRERTEYVLTDKGRDLYPVIVALRQWGDRHLAGEAGVPIHSEHAGCGAAVHAELVCEAGHVVDSGDVVRRPGPGSRLRDAVAG